MSAVHQTALDIAGEMKRWAVISPCERYRYELGREWDESKPLLVLVMINPSTADALTDDHTITKCIGFAKLLGYGGILVVNLYAFRATDVKDLRRAYQAGHDVEGPENEYHLRKALSYAMERNTHVIAAWGSHTKSPDRYRIGRFEVMPGQHGIRLHCLGRTKGGDPNHPLMLAYATPLEVWP